LRDNLDAYDLNPDPNQAREPLTARSPMSTKPNPPPGKPPSKESPPAPVETTLVKFVKEYVVDNEIMRVGDTRRLEMPEASRLVAARRANFAGIMVRVIEGCLLDNVWRSPGEEVEINPELALARHAVGVLTILDPSALPGNAKLPTVQARPKKAPPPDPFKGEPLVRVRALRAVSYPGGSIEPPQEADVPEAWAAQAIAWKAVELCGVAKWTDKAARYLRALVPGRPPPPY
jgi:hypothetical protein